MRQLRQRKAGLVPALAAAAALTWAGCGPARGTAPAVPPGAGPGGRAADNAPRATAGEAVRKVVTTYFVTTAGERRWLAPLALETVTADPDPRVAVRLMLETPPGGGLASAFPPGSKLLGLRVAEGRATVDLHVPPGLSARGEADALRTLVLTLTNFAAIQSVAVTLDGRSTETLAGHLDISRPLGRPPYVNLPEREPGPSERVLVLWFGSPQATTMVPVARVVPRTPAVVQSVIAELQKVEPGLGAVLPRGTRLLGATVKGDLATVDFSREIRSNHPGGTAGESTTLNGIVYSLTEIPTVKRVAILLEGRNGESIAGHVLLDGPLERRGLSPMMLSVPR